MTRAPVVIPVVASIAFTALLCFGRIGEASYCFLLAASALLGLVIHGFGRLQELDLKNLRLVLRELHETKQELFVREEQLKKIALPLAKVIALTAATEGRINDRETHEAKRAWYGRRVEELVEALALNSTDAKEAKKYLEKYAEFDRTIGVRPGLSTADPDYAEAKAKLESISVELLTMLKSDVPALPPSTALERAPEE